MLKVGVVGSRDYPRNQLSDVDKHLEAILAQVPRFQIVTGGAYGVDARAYDWGLSRGYDVKIIPPLDPSKKATYLYRNVEIITHADFVLAFWNGESRGTKFVIDYCKARGKDYKVILPKEDEQNGN